MDYENRIVDTHEIPEDNLTMDNDNPLRPKTLGDYIGQDKVKENLKIYIDAAMQGESPLTMYCYMDLRDLAKQHFLRLLQMNLVLILELHQALQLKSQVT